jgi:hypothetical protein
MDLASSAAEPFSPSAAGSAPQPQSFEQLYQQQQQQQQQRVRSVSPPSASRYGPGGYQAPDAAAAVQLRLFAGGAPDLFAAPAGAAATPAAAPAPLASYGLGSPSVPAPPAASAFGATPAFQARGGPSQQGASGVSASAAGGAPLTGANLRALIASKTEEALRAVLGDAATGSSSSRDSDGSDGWGGDFGRHRTADACGAAAAGASLHQLAASPARHVHDAEAAASGWSRQVPSPTAAAPASEAGFEAALRAKLRAVGELHPAPGGPASTAAGDGHGRSASGGSHGSRGRSASPFEASPHARSDSRSERRIGDSGGAAQSGQQRRGRSILDDDDLVPSAAPSGASRRHEYEEAGLRPLHGHGGTAGSRGAQGGGSEGGRAARARSPGAALLRHHEQQLEAAPRARRHLQQDEDRVTMLHAPPSTASEGLARSGARGSNSSFGPTAPAGGPSSANRVRFDLGRAPSRGLGAARR